MLLALALHLALIGGGFQRLSDDEAARALLALGFSPEKIPPR